MPVVSSSFTRDHDQTDGRFWVTESHVMADGTTQQFMYLCSPPDDPQTIMDIRSSQIDANEIAEATRVPVSVTAPQARRAISAFGLRAAVEAAVAAADQSVRDLWYETDIVDRDNPALLALSTALGLTSVQVDDLFRTAGRM